jgi:hypothetical protein
MKWKDSFKRLQKVQENKIFLTTMIVVNSIDEWVINIPFMYIMGMILLASFADDILNGVYDDDDEDDDRDGGIPVTSS